MDPTINVEIVVASVTILAAIILGYRSEKMGGAIMLGIGTLIASALCMIGTQIGLGLAGNSGGWVGLIIGMLVPGILSWYANKLPLLNIFIQEKSGKFAAVLWFGYCTLCIFGYLAGGWLGLLTITLPAVAVFWIGLYRISYYTLPLRDLSERPKAFRSLLTWTMGTNYPYYFIKDGEIEQRVGGNPYGQFFAGPGLIYTDCDHAAYVDDGISVKGVFEPGLNFTSMFDLPPKALDLRTQLRAFHVEAKTRDGFLIRVLVFAPFRVDTGGKKIDLDQSFPFDHQAVYNIVAGELYKRNRQEKDFFERKEKRETRRLKWDGELVPALVAPIVRDIIGQYKVDELCAPLDPKRDPRVEIASKMKEQAKEILQPLGIELVGGGISNLVPLDEAVIERRIDNWKTQWEQRFLEHLTRGQVERAIRLKQARAEAEKEIFLKFGRALAPLKDAAAQAALTSRFIDSIGETVTEFKTQWPLPEETQNTLERLYGWRIEGHR
jgi:regulator of protease activity HflC (stomatin/prohibitin superfamily)